MLQTTASKYVKQKQRALKGEIDNSTIIGGNINIPFSATEKLLDRKSA